MLFRLLTTRPRPVWSLDFRIRAAPSVALFVRALTGKEDAAAFTSSWDEPEEIQNGVAARNLVTVALCDAQARPMLDYDHTGQLDERELYQLALAVMGGLNIVSPVFWRCAIDAWRAKLRSGAQHFTNVADMMTMAESGEPTYDLGTRQWRPDRYYGAPLCDLTDGQILAYDAAQLAYRDKVPKAKEQKWPKANIPQSPR